MIQHIRNRLALRSALIISLTLAVACVAVVTLTFRQVQQHEINQVHDQHEELLDAMEDTARIAAFLEDRQLAKEVIEGLATSETIAAASLTSSDTVLAASDEGSGLPSHTTLPSKSQERALYSPFDPSTQLGALKIVSNDEAIRRTTFRLALIAGAYQLALVVFIGLIIMLFMHFVIVRPISRLSNQLHHLRVELGQKLDPVAGHDRDEIGRLIADINAMIDHLVKHINQEKALRLEKEVSEEKLRIIFENAHSGIAIVSPDGRLQSYNPAFRHFFNLDAQADQETRTLGQVVGSDGPRVGKLLNECAESGRTRRLQITLPHNRKRWLELVATPNQDGTIELLSNDITNLKQASFAAETRAVTDPLTGLGNRLGFERYFRPLFEKGFDRPPTPFALIYLDLDYFKEVNDTYGHSAGDLVLQEVARTLQRLTRKTDYLARLGGDEFVIVIEDIATREVATGIAASLLESLRAAIKLSGNHSARIGASIGIAFGKTGSGNADAVIEAADTAMYQAKQQGRNRYCLAPDAVGPST